MISVLWAKSSLPSPLVIWSAACALWLPQRQSEASSLCCGTCQQWARGFLFLCLYHKIATFGGYIKRWEIENPLTSQIVYMVQEGGDVRSLQYCCASLKRCCIPIWPQLSLRIPLWRLGLIPTFPFFFAPLLWFWTAEEKFLPWTKPLFASSPSGSLERELGRHAKLWHICRQHGWSSQ